MTKPFADIEQYPQIVLRDWMIWAVNLNNHHLIGIDEDRNYRVSSGIIKWNPHNFRFETKSGTIYQIVGWYSSHATESKTWQNWLKKNNVNIAMDVTWDYIAAIEEMNNESRKD